MKRAGRSKIGGPRLFYIRKEGGYCFFWYKDKDKGGQYHSARFIRSQFKKVRLLNQLDRMEYKHI